MLVSIKATDVLKFEIKPFLFGVFFSRIMPKPDGNKPEMFYLYTSFRSSKAVFKSDFSLEDYAHKLLEQYNYFSGYENWSIHAANKNRIELRFYIKNDLNINSSEFYNLIYKKLLNESWLHNDKFNEEKKHFIRGYMEPRGSIDTTIKLIAQDYFYNNSFELKRVQLLTDMMNLPISHANFNPRNMQPQYVSGTNKRNAQFRINLFFYAKNIGFINEYKAKIFEKAYKITSKYIDKGIIYFNCNVPEVSSSVQFVKYINFFTNNIYNKDLNAEKIKVLRKQLGFEDKIADGINLGRNKTIINIFDEISEDKCSLCGTTETFTKKANGRQSFQIHHMIPFHNGVEYDNIANLVKLCPTCHASLKKGASPKIKQVSNLITILHKQEAVYEYTSAALGIDNINELAETIWSLLG